MTAEPNTTLWSWGSPAAGWAALSTWLGACRRSDTTSAVSRTAMSTIPAFRARAGARATSPTPRVTQLSPDSTRAATSPVRAWCSTQASANRGATAAPSAGRAPGTTQPRATAASGGTAIRAR